MDTVGRCDADEEHVEDELIGNEPSLIDVFLGFFTERSLISDMFSKKLAGRDVGQMELLAEWSCVGAFAGARGADEEDD